MKWVQMYEDVEVPLYETNYSSGMDIRAYIPEPVDLYAGNMVAIPTGLKVRLPHWAELVIRPRSGLAFKYCITLINSPGTVDADYEGEIKVGLINLGRKKYVINPGDRIAQAIYQKVSRIDRYKKDKYDGSRGQGGFGHTGV